MALIDGLSCTANYPIAKLTVVMLCFFGYVGVFVLACNVLRVWHGVSRPEAVASIVVSTVHALVCFTLAMVTVLRDFGDIGANGAEPLLGSIGLCVSIAYFVWDICHMWLTDYRPFLPLLLHHVLSGASMTLIAFWVPRAVWYACLLQLSEGTVPIYNVVAYLEWHGRRGTIAYALARWALLGTWLLLRVALIVYFFHVVCLAWAGMTDIVRLLAINGPALLVFNLVALITVVIDGFPWLADCDCAKRR